MWERLSHGLLLNCFARKDALSLIKDSVRYDATFLYLWVLLEMFAWVIFHILCFASYLQYASILLVYLSRPCWFQSVGRVNFLLRSSWHSVLQTSALSHCVQACNTAKGEKKRYSRRQVRCNFNLKLKAPLTACFQLRGPAKRESKRGIEWEMSGAMQRSGRQTERECWREEQEHKERTVRVWETEQESKARESEKRGKNTCQPSSSERWVQ